MPAGDSRRSSRMPWTGWGTAGNAGRSPSRTCARSARALRRDRARICVVENPADVVRIEAGTDYRGVYFVLMGNLSPLDGIGPGDLGLDQLARRLGDEGVAELVLATGATAEGEATAHYLAEMAREHDVTATRIAQGVPLGGDLEFVDAGTLAHAFSGRREIVL